MIHALRYEPQSQRQRFEPREQRRGVEQDRHIHLHFHLNLTFWARRERSTHPNAIRLRRIFAALLAATVMPLMMLPLALPTPDGPPPTALENLVLVSSCVSVVAGLTLAWYAVGVLLHQARRASPGGSLDLFLPLAWRVSPGGRLGLFLSLLPLLLFLIAVACFLFGPPGVVPFFW